MKLLYCTLTLLLISISLSGQKILRIEKYDDPKSIEYYSGQNLIYQLDGDERWRTRKIKSLDYENQLIIFDVGYEPISNIKNIKRFNKIPKYLGMTLMRFSAAWFIYGGITELVNEDWSFDRNIVSIGVGAFVTGFILSKFASTKIYGFESKNRLRIIDISWPEPRG